MGAGVAQPFAIAGYPVRLQDIAEAALTRGKGAIKKGLERLVARGSLEPKARDAALQRIAPTTRIDDFADCDVVVEAVLERFDVKKAVWRTSTASAGRRRSSPPTLRRSRSPG
jgi:3-hydroxybutyryl-CoA dehydrogenase